MTGPPTVIICDDHPVFRASLRSLLDREGFVVGGEADSEDAAVVTASREHPDLCVIGMECARGAGVVSEVHAASPETAIVVLTASRNRDDFFAAIRAGAIGYLPKQIDAASLSKALHGIVIGKAAIPPTLVASLVREFRTRHGRRAVVGRNGGSALTPQEWEVAHMLADRLTTKEIARRLRLSPVTIRRHASSIMSKLDVPDREAAIVVLKGPARS